MEHMCAAASHVQPRLCLGSSALTVGFLLLARPSDRQQKSAPWNLCWARCGCACMTGRVPADEDYRYHVLCTTLAGSAMRAGSSCCCHANSLPTPFRVLPGPERRSMAAGAAAGGCEGCKAGPAGAKMRPSMLAADKRDSVGWAAGPNAAASRWDCSLHHFCGTWGASSEGSLESFVRRAMLRMQSRRKWAKQVVNEAASSAPATGVVGRLVSCVGHGWLWRRQPPRRRHQLCAQEAGMQAHAGRPSQAGEPSRHGTQHAQLAAQLPP